MSGLLRVYHDPEEIQPDGYPFAWHYGSEKLKTLGFQVTEPHSAIKDEIRERDGHRCLRCRHPYTKGQHGNGQWSPCDVYCVHGDPIRVQSREHPAVAAGMATEGVQVWKEAEWRILTVHHLNGVKHDCRWWNLVSLCQQCHLTIQGKVWMDRPYNRPHSEWFRVFAAGFYAWKYLDLELTVEETIMRMDDLLCLELRQDALW